MYFKSISFVAAAVLFGTFGAANAATVLNTSLARPGVYYGAGNSNSNFTVDRTGNVELGLSAIERYVGPIVPVGSTIMSRPRRPLSRARPAPIGALSSR